VDGEHSDHAPSVRFTTRDLACCAEVNVIYLLEQMPIHVVLANPWEEWEPLDLAKLDQYTTSPTVQRVVVKDIPSSTVQDILPLLPMFLTPTVVIHHTQAVE